MKLIIYNKNDYEKSFIYNYLKLYMTDLLISHYNYSRAIAFNKLLKIDVFKVLNHAIKTMNITEDANSYILSVNKNLKFGNYNLKSLLNYITYGSRDIKGYRILYDILNIVGRNIDIIYKEWEDGN